MKVFNNYSHLKDPVFKKMSNLMMREGKRTKSEKILNESILYLDKICPGEGLTIFYLAIYQCRHEVGLRIKPTPKKRRKKNQLPPVYIPYRINSMKKLTEGMRCLLKSARKEPNTLPFSVNLGKELLKASLNKGDSVSERFRINRIARENKRRLHLGGRETLLWSTKNTDS